MKVRIWRSGHELRGADLRRPRDLHLSTKRVAELQVVRITVDPDRRRSAAAQEDGPRERLPALPGAGRPRPERPHPRAPARPAPLPTARSRQLLLLRHGRRGAGLPEGERPGAHRPRHAGVWRRLQTAHTPRPRYRYGHHIEVDKTKQVLFEVDHGRVVRVVHVSTGATGNTPVGLWHIYSKVPGRSRPGCSTRTSSCAASRSTAIRRCPRTPPRTAASASRSGSRRSSSRRATTAKPVYIYY